jgi:hypothetical protein
MKRGGPLKRTTPLKRTPMKRKPARREKLGAERQAAVLSRDHWTCQAHNWGFALNVECSGRNHVHHRRLLSHGTDHSMENLLTLCEAHHRHAHDVDRAGAEAAGVIVRH